MKVKNIMLAVGCALAFTACADLDYEEYTHYDKNYVYTDFDRVDGVVTNVYSYLDYDMPGSSAFCSGCDEADYAWSFGSSRDFINGSWSPTNSHSQWSIYTGIRAANLFLEDVKLADFSELELDKDYEAYMKRFNRYEWEVRFLRAYFYFALVRAYGDVPLVTTVLTEAEANSVARTPADEVFKFIVDECDAILAADMLPTDYSKLVNDKSSATPAETGRITKQTVLALKARTLLYWASPLFNPSDDKSRWHDAAVACKAVIDLCQEIGISLGNYADIWATGTSGNWQGKEMIYVRRIGDTNTYEYANFPMGLENGSSGNCPTQTLVDAYEMQATGLAINELGSGYVSADPYAGRDPRLALTIAVNGETWPTTNPNPLETYYGGRNGQPTVGATTTGYYLKKHLDGTINISSTNTSASRRHNWPIYRLGEFYLNYAEAMANYYGPYTTGDGTLNLTAVEAVNVVRSRVGMPDFPTGMTLAEFTTKYRRERMVELAFESHRFWDVRRWKIGAETQASIRVMNITLNADGSVSYNPTTVNRVWDDKMLLFPIPQSEMLKNGNLTQNPGW